MRGAGAGLALLALLLAGGAAAEPPDVGTVGAAGEPGAGATKDAPESQAKSEGSAELEGLTGDWGGLRTRLKEQGVALEATEILEVLGNVSGGTRTGAIVEGRLEMALDVDLAKLAGLDGASFHVDAFQVHGRGLSANHLNNNLNTASSIEAPRDTYLYTLWVQQSFFEDTLSLRLGQLVADDDFLSTQYAGPLVNGAFGWPTLPTAALPSGGPAFPYGTPGARVRYAPSESFAAQFAVFNGDPGGPDPERDDAGGTRFDTSSEALAIGELQFATEGKPGSGSLPASYKVGGWYHTGRFDDLRTDSTGRPLGSPASTGNPAQHRGNWSLYGVVDQMLWRQAGTDDVGLGAFLRVQFAPDRQSPVNVEIDAGLNYKGPFEGREDDVATIGVVYAQISPTLTGYDRDLRRLSGLAVPRRDFEGVVELTYQLTVTPWLTIQPDVQFILHPTAAGAAPAAGPTQGDATILGLRTTIKL